MGRNKKKSNQRKKADQIVKEWEKRLEVGEPYPIEFEKQKIKAHLFIDGRYREEVPIEGCPEELKEYPSTKGRAIYTPSERKRTRDMYGKLTTFYQWRFSDLKKPVNDAGEEIPIEEVIPGGRSVFDLYQVSEPPNLKIYEGLTSEEKFVLFHIIRRITKRQLAKFFDVSSKTIHRWEIKAKMKIKKWGLKYYS